MLAKEHKEFISRTSNISVIFGSVTDQDALGLISEISAASMIEMRLVYERTLRNNLSFRRNSESLRPAFEDLSVFDAL